MNPAIRAVTLDVGGTLIEPYPSVGHIYSEVAARHGHKVFSPEHLDAGFARAWQTKGAFRHSREDWARLVAATFDGLLRPEETAGFFGELYREFERATAWRVFDDVRPALVELNQRGVRLAVLSNWDERLRPLLCELDLGRHFEALFISCEVGASKPQKEIFLHAASQMNLPPESMLHVGDSRSEDIAGAQQAGFQALLLDRSQEVSLNGTLSSLTHLLLFFWEKMSQ